MPFNQLILPLLGGYVFINHTYLTCYWASRHSKEHLLFLSAVTGAFLLLLARLVTGLALHTRPGYTAAVLLHRIAPYPGIGTAVLAFFFGFALRIWFNKTWTKARAPLWLYAAGTFSQLENLLFASSYPIQPEKRLVKHPWYSLIAGLFCLDERYLRGRWKKSTSEQQANGSGAPTGPEVAFGPRPVMLCLRNRKIYVGLVYFNLPMRAESKPFVVILPAWSGYRDKDTLRVVPTEDYDSVIDLMKTMEAREFTKIICLDDIDSASFYDSASFQCFAGDDEPTEVTRYVPFTERWSMATSRMPAWSPAQTPHNTDASAGSRG